MKRKLLLALALTLLVGMLNVTLNVQKAEASGTVYIKTDGSVDPPTAPISTVDNVTYILTGNITSDADGIVIERDNTIVDGAGYTIQGTGVYPYKGIDLSGRSNVTIKNSEIAMFESGICLHWSSNITISGNNITNNDYGIELDSSSNNSISGDNITANDSYGIYLYSSSNNNIYGNNITANNWYGIWLRESSNDNNIAGNNVTANNDFGIVLSYSSNNMLRNNSMAKNGRNFGVYGDVPSYFLNDVDASNTVDGKPVCYWISRQDTEVPPDIGYLALVNCTRITVKNLNLTNNREGILLVSTTNSTIIKNNMASNDCGFDLEWSFNNTISGNNATANNVSGICLIESSNNNIAGNNITANAAQWGSIYLYESSKNTISGNNITNNYDGICLYDSSNNSIVGNSITNNWKGVYLSGSSNNTIAGNTFTNDGLAVFDSYGNLVEENFVNDKPLVYLEGRSGYAVENAGQVILVNCTYITIENLNLSNTTVGIQLWRTNNTKITNSSITNNRYDGIGLDGSINNSMVGNSITNNSRYGIHLSGFSDYNSISGNNITANNWYGICLDYSSNNSIVGNNITNNDYGIWFYDSSNNRIYHNNFINNTNQVTNYAVWSVNVWDDGWPSGGNYWSNYTRVDEKSGPNQDLPGSDGIGDTPYIIDENNRDRYPLINPWTPPEHDIAVSITAPVHIQLGSSTSLNATVTNKGLNDEVDVEFLLLINGTTTNSTIIPHLQPGNSYTLNYLWTPTVKGKYNVTAYARPVLGETSTENNQETEFATVSPPPEVGVEAGDWMKCDYTITGWPAGTPYPEWLKVEFLSVEGTNASVRVTMHMSDGMEQNATVPVDVVAGGEVLGLSGFIVPANLTVGDVVYVSGYGNVAVAGETTGSYAGAGRTVVYAGFSQYGTQLTYYWDKQTGVMVEASTTSGTMTGTAKATETNMWEVIPEFPSFLTLLVFMIATLLAVMVCRRKTRVSDVM